MEIKNTMKLHDWMHSLASVLHITQTDKAIRNKPIARTMSAIIILQNTFTLCVLQLA